ncbi:PEP-CTERM sorting domain-containing protein [Allorhodopirellula heiligendammensis]|uniref:PEP-CTERM protein-sorting domain-containing protein n=1 Tax=Allorhodopirellula heiligendammensis TaxID=2714739 RepID=A0A5C6BZN9_9BACT|nr:PEP-CTERM sorting domain-containing protein [Allorhodopirellula heiligendammensis]TWU16706.1 hypothetical protein Poly21_39120 [Allorhodopirellula heiligendammensis]
MKIRHLTILSLAACASLIPRSASAELLAGFHQFDLVTQVGVGYTKAGADEGVFAATSSITYNTGSTDTGGSTDNWYGPDGSLAYPGPAGAWTPASGGAMTNQTPIAANSPGTVNGPYVFEATNPAGLRLAPGYATNAPTPPNTIGGADSTADGRIRSFNGTDVQIENSTSTTYRLDSFVFDAFVGDVSTAGAIVNMEDFVLTYFGADGSTSSANVSVSAGYAGYNTQSGEDVNEALANPLIVNNQIDYGVGTNYLDYVVNLNGFLLKPGDIISIGLNATAVGGTARGDNFAFFGTAVPEPSSTLALGMLFGIGAWNLRRKRNRKPAAESA